MAADATPAEAALLAGMIASPSLYDPVENPRQAKHRRDLVLARMLEQQKISRAQYDEGVATDLPTQGGHRSAGGGLEPAVLLDLADAAARGPLPPGDRVRRRARDQDDDRPRAPGGGGAGDLGPALGLRAERLAGGDREQDGRGEGDGRRRRTTRRARSTSPPTATASPAPPSSRSPSSARWPTGSARRRPSCPSPGRSTSPAGRSR